MVDRGVGIWLAHEEITILGILMLRKIFQFVWLRQGLCSHPPSKYQKVARFLPKFLTFLSPEKQELCVKGEISLSQRA